MPASLPASGRRTTSCLNLRAGNDAGELVKQATITVLHNGVVVQNRYELTGITGGITREVPWKTPSKYGAPHPPEVFLELQYHNNPVRFRNIWIRPMGEKQ